MLTLILMGCAGVKTAGSFNSIQLIRYEQEVFLHARPGGTKENPVCCNFGKNQ